MCLWQLFWGLVLSADAVFKPALAPVHTHRPCTGGGEHTQGDRGLPRPRSQSLFRDRCSAEKLQTQLMEIRVTPDPLEALTGTGDCRELRGHSASPKGPSHFDVKGAVRCCSHGGAPVRWVELPGCSQRWQGSWVGTVVCWGLGVGRCRRTGCDLPKATSVLPWEVVVPLTAFTKEQRLALVPDLPHDPPNLLTG